MAESTPLTTRDIRSDIADILGDDQALERCGGDLIAAGLDSLGVMRLAGRWRAAGTPVRYADLIERPTLAQWEDLLAGTGLADVPDTPAAAVDDDAPFDLATMQHAYWVGRQEHLVLGGVATHFYAEFDGHGVDPDRLEAAMRRVVGRHGMLRARFTDDGRQQIMPSSAWAGLTRRDLRASAEPDRLRVLAEVRDSLSHRRFDVAAGEVFDLALTLLPEGRTRLHLNIDMLVADALSFRIILADLAEAYRDPAALATPIGFSYPRYLASRGGEAREAARAYWSARVDHLPPAPRLPLRVAPEKLTRQRVTRRHHRMPAAVAQLLGERARAAGVTLSSAFATAYSLVLAAWNERPDFLLNIPLFDREPLHPDVDRLIGDFTNLLVVAVDTAGAASFADQARALQTRIRRDTAHADYSGLEVLRDVARATGAERALAPVVFTSALGLGPLFSRSVRDVFGDAGWSISQAPQVWLDYQVVEEPDGLLLNWDAVEGLFQDGVLDAMFEAHLRLLDRLVTDPSAWTGPLAPLIPAGALAIRDRLNATGGEQRQTTLHEEFFRIAADHPGRPALLWGESGSTTYADLADAARRLAGRLTAAGLRRGEPVAVALPKGPAQAEAVLGVLAAGGVFVPVSIDQPAARRAQLYRRAGARLIVTDDEHRGDAALLDDGRAIVPDGSGTAGTEPVRPDPDDLAYIMFTSGSTGTPKGVEITHRASANTIEDLADRTRFGPDDRVLAVSALDHDLAVFDLFVPLSRGGAVVLVDEAARRDAQEWARLVRRRRVTVWQSVPALLEMMLVAAEQEPVGDSLRLALVGGDFVGLDLSERLTERVPGARLVALGGTTEASIHSTWFPVSGVPAACRSVPYGPPLRNQQVRVADHSGHDRPDWVPGELWIGGAGLAKGYRGDPERTAQRFVEHLGQRWYRTGDLARYHADGTLEVLGRTDFQLKILGHRIDPGEIEAVLAAHPSVAAAKVFAAGPQRDRLVAAIVPAGSTVDHADVLGHLAGRLPPYLVPQQILTRPVLPLSANGKVDTAQLAALAGAEMSGRTADATAGPDGPVEAAVAGLWQDFLGIGAIGRDDNFFALGGNSLLATRLIGRLRREGHPEATLSALFAAPTLRGFAASLAAGSDGVPATAPHRPEADPAHRYEPFPLTEVQRAYWLGRRPEFTLGGVGAHWYWEFDGDSLDPARLEQAWNAVVQRHDMLRAVIDEDGRQRVLSDVPWTEVRVTDAGPGGSADLAAMRAEMSGRVYRAETWPLWDIRVVRYGAGRARVAISLDLVTVDALSIMVIFADLAELYRGAELPPLELTFRDCLPACAADPEAVARDREYWTGRLAELPPAPALPTHRPDGRPPRFERMAFRLPPEQWRRLQATAAVHEVTPSSVVAAAFARVLEIWSGQSAFTLNYTLFNRPDVHPDVYRIVGDFTSLLLVANQPVTGESFADAVRRLHREVWAGLEHQAYGGLSVMRDLAARAGGEVLMPVVFTSTLGVAAVTDRPFGLELPFGRYHWGVSQTPQVLLDHQVTEDAGGLLLNFDLVPSLFADGVPEALFAAYRALLEHLCSAGADWSRPAAVPLPAPQIAERARANDTGGPASGRRLHDGFLDRTARSPGRVALRWGDDGSMSYGDLLDRSMRVAGALAAAGVKAGSPVAVTLPKGPDQVVAVLAVLLAGGCYVPVGVDQPAARRHRVYRNAGVAHLLHDDPAMVAPDGVRAIAMTAAGTADPLATTVSTSDSDLAYVIYTSGSTGDPKGVEITHRAAVNTIDDINRRTGAGPDDRVLAVSALDFDLSVYDIFGLLAAGGAVVLIGPADTRDPQRWLDLVERHAVTMWNSVPTLLEMLVVTATAANRRLPIRVALVSGDWVGLDLHERLAAVSGARLLALGGATEAAIWSNSYEVTGIPPDWTSVPYGFPLTAQRFRVVDEHGADRPDWVPGELWIGGAGVARGYRGDPGRTAERFVTADGERWYRTGDLGRYRPGGILEFLGRTDHQVKVGGHRIELGEIEAALDGHPGVRHCVVLAPGGRSRRLAAVVVPEPGADPPDAAALSAHLAALLPGHMVPDRITLVAALPLTANGKVDRRRAADLVGSPPPPVVAAAPEGAMEESVAGIWAGLLDTPVADRHVSFFALGGDSLLATRLVAEIGRSLGVEVPLRELLDEPTVERQAAAVARRLAAGRTDLVEMEQGAL